MHYAIITHICIMALLLWRKNCLPENLYWLKIASLWFFENFEIFEFKTVSAFKNHNGGVNRNLVAPPVLSKILNVNRIQNWCAKWPFRCLDDDDHSFQTCWSLEEGDFTFRKEYHLRREGGLSWVELSIYSASMHLSWAAQRGEDWGEGGLPSRLSSRRRRRRRLSRRRRSRRRGRGAQISHLLNSP